MNEKGFIRGDSVVAKTEQHYQTRPCGVVLRVAKDGTWADIRWAFGAETWSKRMQTRFLVCMNVKGIDNE